MSDPKAAAADDEEVDDGYSCKACCEGYCGCVIAVVKVN